MGDKIRCPRCKQQTFQDARYSIIRDEIICFSGKCLNCEYEITAESLFELLTKKFDLQTEFDSLVTPLEYTFFKVPSTDEEIRNRILQALVRGYEKKAEQSDNEDEVEKYLYKKINYEQVLEGKKFDEADVLTKLGFFYFLNEEWAWKAAECFEKVLSLDPAHGCRFYLVQIYERFHNYKEALKHLDIFYASYDKFQLPSSKDIDGFSQNYYFNRKGELLYYKGAYEEAISFLQKVEYTPEMMRDLDGEKEEEMEETTDSSVSSNISVKALMLKSFVRLKEYDRAEQTYNDILAIDPSYEDAETLIDLFINDDPDFFLSLLKTLMETDIARAFRIARAMEPCMQDFSDNVAYIFMGSFLKGIIYLKYNRCEASQNEIRTGLLDEADKCFQTTLTTYDWNSMGGRYLLSSTITGVVPQRSGNLYSVR